MPLKFILDTDIGDDIDDALALALSLSSPELELLGVTTVFRNTPARARMAKAILQLAGHPDIPVYAGCGQPINNPVDETEIPIQVGPELDNITYEDGHAVDFLIRQAKVHGKQLTLCPIGALTNIALAIRQDKAMLNIGEIVLMGGSFYRHCNEWNILCDPEAAHIVFSSGIPIRAIGLDVTTRCVMSDAQVAQVNASAHPLQRQLALFIQRWMAQTHVNPMLHDPLAVTAMWNPAYLTFEPAQVQVETQGKYTRGTTFSQGYWGKVQESHTQVACDVRPDAFLEEFMRRVFA